MADVTRRCLAPECVNNFDVDERSTERYCSPHCAPVYVEPKVTPHRMKTPPEVKDAVFEACEKGWTAPQICAFLLENGMKRPDGSAYKPANIYSMMCRATGLTRERTPVAAKLKLKRDAESDEDSDSLTEVVKKQKDSRLPKFALDVLSNDELDDWEKVQMLKVYGGIDV